MAILVISEIGLLKLFDIYIIAIPPTTITIVAIVYKKRFDIRTLSFIEDNGKLCIITKKNQIVKNPELMVLDGKINYDYLKLTNMTEEDVISLIKKEGYKNC